MAAENIVLPTNFMRSRKGEENADVKKAATTFRDRFDGEDASVAKRQASATTLVNEYYDLVTDFYEFGWGQMFHFAPRYSGETFNESLVRHEHLLALKAGFKPGQKLIDVGCGVGGPLRNIQRFTGCHITGINNNAYQIKRAKRADKKLGLDEMTDYVRCDFNEMPLPDNSMDGAYAIEATCHAADKTRCYTEVFRVLKPGAHFVAYEWIITDKYDAGNEEHRKIRHGIELGNALPTLGTANCVKTALKNAGFEVQECFDLVEVFEKNPAKQLPWYAPLQGNYTSIDGFRATPVGRWATSTMIKAMEVIRLAPTGSHNTAQILEEAAVNLVRGGQLSFFTPSYFLHGVKPKH